MLSNLGIFIISYLIGSIPFGLLITKMLGLGDVRKIGSGNIGATNVLRTGSKPAAAATLLLDAFKGFMPFLIFGGAPLATAIILIGVLLGHCLPVWLKFKGGKGVAAYIGAIFGIAWPLGIIACLTWLVTAVLKRISSLSALVMVAIVPIIALFTQPFIVTIALILAALFIAWRHKDNIKRIMEKTEPRIGKK